MGNFFYKFLEVAWSKKKLFYSPLGAISKQNGDIKSLLYFFCRSLVKVVSLDTGMVCGADKLW